MITDQDIINALKVVANKYGRPNAMTVERLFRNETAHFKSDNFLQTLSPGMEVGRGPGNTPITYAPYGWTSLGGFWKDNPGYAPSGTMEEEENTSALASARGVRVFMCFPNIEASMMTVAFRLATNNWNAGAWFANDQHPDAQKKYSDYLDKISPKFCLVNIPA